MTLQEILNMIRIKCPHSYDDSDIITMVDDKQKRIFRTLYKPESATTYDIIADNPFYPISFSPENIIDVVVDGEEYPYQNIKYDSQCRYYYITDDNSVGIYPTPEENVTSGLTIFHYKEPTSLGDASDTPELDPTWHMMLVYHVCKELALMGVNEDKLNAYVAEINDIERQFNRSRQARPHRIQDVYGVGRGVV